MLLDGELPFWLAPWQCHLAFGSAQICRKPCTCRVGCRGVCDLGDPGGQARSHWRGHDIGPDRSRLRHNRQLYVGLHCNLYAGHAPHVGTRWLRCRDKCQPAGDPAVLLGGGFPDRYGRWPINSWGNLAFLLLVTRCFTGSWQPGNRQPLILSMTILAVTSNFIVGSYQAGLAESYQR